MVVLSTMYAGTVAPTLTSRFNNILDANGLLTAGTTLGMARTWWTSTGDGWGTSLSTAIDFNMTNGTGVDAANAADDIVPGFWTLTMNLGFGF